ncbi:hypothetical protein GWG54_17250 [Natronococcus sp. JC468]|uniref:hypothetical protein n=1 Tax=Natronococcus sp. JC468 TaxID=1961921 RepID=UPI00143B07A3|nr:hypothetical protein [Natronococcus sp. JC468]NKE37521.1 hypothetical protein [Natronococcus sp. JC468]
MTHEDLVSTSEKQEHVRYYVFVAGVREIPTWGDESAITLPFGEFIDDITDGLEPSAGASSSRSVATDGGITVHEAADDTEILESGESDPWDGPFPEYDCYGQLTGERYFRCRSCGREVLESIGCDAVGHRTGAGTRGSNVATLPIPLRRLEQEPPESKPDIDHKRAARG